MPKKSKSLEDLFEDEIRDLLNAEKQVLAALPKMSKKVESDELRQIMEEHLEQTKKQIDRLEQVFEEMGKPAKGKTCKAMQGIIEEGKEIMEETLDEDTIDAGIIAASQKVEHYEIASYGTVAAWAKMLGLERSAELLTQTLEEEKNADKMLTKMALSKANKRANQGAHLGHNHGDFEDE